MDLREVIFLYYEACLRLYGSGEAPRLGRSLSERGIPLGRPCPKTCPCLECVAMRATWEEEGEPETERLPGRAPLRGEDWYRLCLGPAESSPVELHREAPDEPAAPSEPANDTRTEETSGRDDGEPDTEREPAAPAARAPESSCSKCGRRRFKGGDCNTEACAKRAAARQGATA